MAKLLTEIVAKLKVDELQSLLAELDVTYDETLKKQPLADLLIESIPSNKTIDENGKLVEKTVKDESVDQEDKPASRNEVRRRKQVEMLPEGKVRLTDNIKFKGVYHKKGDIIEVSQEEEDMLNANGLVEF